MYVEDAYAKGDVTGNSDVASLIGHIYRYGKNRGMANVYITNTYAVGNATALSGKYAGGLVGNTSSWTYGNSNISSLSRSSMTATNSYWAPETTGQATSVLGTPRTIAEMLIASNYEGWNFETIWAIEENETLAYLRNVDKPEDVNKENLTQK